MSYEATQAALDYYDAIDRPAVDAMRQHASPSLDLRGFTNARRSAADRVRAAYLKDTAAFNSPENVELMSVEKIRRAIGGTMLGKMLGLLP